MQKFRFSLQSNDRLKLVHPDLRRVACLALEISEIDFMVTEGKRNITRQKALYAAGATKTLNSKHLNGHAIDVAAVIDGEVRWDWPLYAQIAKAFKAAAKELEIPIQWGGDWKTFKDGPHFELGKAAQ